MELKMNEPESHVIKCSECFGVGTFSSGLTCRICKGSGRVKAFPTEEAIKKLEKAKLDFDTLCGDLKAISKVKAMILKGIQNCAEETIKEYVFRQALTGSQYLKDCAIGLYYLSIIGEVPSNGIALGNVSVPPIFNENKEEKK